MRYWLITLFSILIIFCGLEGFLGSLSPTLARTENTTLPRGKGQPIIVKAGLFFADVSLVNEKTSTFTATVDLRLRWKDLKKHDISRNELNIQGPEVDKFLSETWHPDVEIANLVGEPSFKNKGLIRDTDGQIELMERITGSFAIQLDVKKFPFDKQNLAVEIVVRNNYVDTVMLDYQRSEIEYSKPIEKMEISGWIPGTVEIKRENLIGWHGNSFSRLIMGLQVKRMLIGTISPIFLPLFSSLLIPLLAIWTNKFKDGEFQIESYELANIIIGGLFAMIALNYSVNSVYENISAGDNTVNRLFGLDYLALGFSLLINTTLFRFNLVKRWFGIYVQEQLYDYLIWSAPLLVFSTAVTFLMLSIV